MKGNEKPSKKTDESVRMKDLIVGGMQEKKAKDIVCIDLRNLKNAVADFFVVCHADSRTHIDAIARSVEEFVYKKQGKIPFTAKEWRIQSGYCSIMSMCFAHVFRQEQREFYGIERLWADAEIQRIASNY
ncbi:MAG: ribosome silencing factor [Bacteroidetes bacterium]|nr:ribosome silencing factor [Bacteroidota bacterium]